MDRWKEIKEILIHNTYIDYEDAQWILNKIEEQGEEITRLKEYIKHTNEHMQRSIDGSKYLLKD